LAAKFDDSGSLLVKQEMEEENKKIVKEIDDKPVIMDPKPQYPV
jgi:hypothetical protein